MKIESYKDLIAWQKSMDLTESIYHVTAKYPAVERFGLVSQTRRASVSIASNIAEGYGRRCRADYVRFLDIARGSANEVETQLLLAVRLQFITNAEAAAVIDLVAEIQRILKGLVNSLEASVRTSVKT